MPKRTKPVPDSDTPEWTAETFAGAKRFRELPAEVQTVLSGRKRGPQKAPTKRLISIRLSQDVLAAVRSTGPGWQGRVDDVLRDEFVKREASRPPKLKRSA